MATEEDNFDIDIYGDGEGETNGKDNGEHGRQDELDSSATPAVSVAQITQPAMTVQLPKTDSSLSTQVNTEQVKERPEEKIKPPPQQGIKRKETSDERPIDNGATNALMVSDLHWWTTEDDIRGWANGAGAEDELREITFSEHKVNGKSKGYVFEVITCKSCELRLTVSDKPTWNSPRLRRPLQPSTR